MRPLRILLSVVVLLGVAFLARAEGPPPQPRTALIIGNAAYSFAPLKNPINDAEAMATALEGAGFISRATARRSTARTTFCRSAESSRAWRTSSEAR